MIRQEPAIVVGFQPVVEMDLIKIGGYEFLPQLVGLTAQEGHLQPSQDGNQTDDSQKAHAPKQSPFVPAYLFSQEMAVIGTIGLILNIVGLAISMHVRSILYLDMTGTAVTALLLGPWWGALVGALSNSLFYWFLFPDQESYLAVLPWVLVNMAGGFFWGLLGRTESFRKYVESREQLNLAHLYYLAKFGGFVACVIAVVGAGVQGVLGSHTRVSFDPKLGTAINNLVTTLQQSLSGPFQRMLGDAAGRAVSWGIPIWLQNCVRFIPDKTISAAMALAIIRYGLPLFRRELISGGAVGKPPSDNWIAPTACVFVYLPLFIYFIHAYPRFWLLWISPLAIAGLGVIYLIWRGPSSSEIIQARNTRFETYTKVLGGMRRRGTIRFRDNYGLWFGTAVASVFFLVALPLSGLSVADYYRIALNFSFVVFGFFFAVQLIFIVTAQNLGISRLNECSQSSAEGGGEPTP